MTKGSRTDVRTKHKSCSRKLITETTILVVGFIKTFNGRKSLYYLIDLDSTYLFEKPNLSKLKMFNETHSVYS